MKCLISSFLGNFYGQLEFGKVHRKGKAIGMAALIVTETLKASFNVPSDEQGSHPDDLPFLCGPVVKQGAFWSHFEKSLNWK